MRIIKPGDFDDIRVKALLTRHLQGMHANSPPGHVFALDWSELQASDISFYTLWDAEELLGMGALKELDARSGEIKSMRTADEHLRTGVAAAVLEYIVAEAARRGYTRISLETGSGTAFEPALTLYRNRGFVNGAAFGQYKTSDFNQFLHLTLATHNAVRPILTQALEQDARRIAGLHLRSWHATYTRELTPAFLNGQDLEVWTEGWRRRIVARGLVLLLGDGERLEGFVACGRSLPLLVHTDEWEIFNLHIDPTLHRRGLGSVLFDAAAERGRREGARQLVLWVVKTNDAARAFYEARGMQRDGAEKDDVLGAETLHEVRYRMDL
jgi:putative acetyltransferase